MQKGKIYDDLLAGIEADRQEDENRRPRRGD